MAKSRKPAKKTPRRNSKRPLTLAAFFRKLWTQHKDREFSTNPKRRQEIVESSNLSPAHKRLLKRGCMKDIIAELAGVQLTTANSTVIECADEVECGHPECEAFIAAARNQV
jgi:hypothetical protein